MSARDDEYEDELPPAPEPREATAIEDDEERSGGVPPWAKIGLVLGLLVGGVVFLLLNSDAGDAFAYSTPIHQVVESPEQFQGRNLRVEGDLRQGSIQFREDPCEWRFVLEKEDAEMPVTFPECVVPDTFRDDFGISVTVQGQLQADGTFLASELVPRCPSKYEMQERLESGEEMPHGDPANGPIAGEMPEPS
ncbi:MAG TPA: cytochrome c maturation protein CcmE [Polyangiaceae bacterium LLY-WYZ-15_(1-7)]|nr:cytochrome c maturation protein CcmE [Polyangiaceae bacterium LLY-WYZ-15_(1-7)]HJL03579.1 cytochrome c maturation protein CcmE [Polyangiaceae bacterium LLY-WYZ-15_(1-7)]HJL09379.1 cytochrome c maturation protein CcmE [Polyangiaceae bacterium LLY-WYZ-15_(1-7)]HJL21165.1 cytochrome c maturation protein CcmE [Polyangiaceae bacterium LLY-WYZ-15_(1-7)]HJL35051.1 cytochrome c maturation protein CcmE [Polyangiaceae bacterium LLY-WYZ-15_(1-7)]